ncbi:phosphatase PAP2 family protein [Brevibacillus sp. SYSU BS000544]|uniref:phosphatase PAP2 family protein n=1 Tax=Brevibacillus sp. SYSU BS000544 TaxID=3416443 RepID=UPI003CE572C1
MNRTNSTNSIGSPFLHWSLLFVILFFIVLASFLSGAILAFDQQIVTDVTELHTPFLTNILHVITLAGNGSFLAPFAVLIIGAAFLMKKRLEALVLLATLLGCEALSEGLKEVFERPRPDGYNLIELPTSYSMPSGHALVGGAFYTMLTLLLSRVYRHVSFGKMIPLIGFGFVTLLIFSRVYLGVHYPSDVLAGLSLGLSWMFLVYHFYFRKLIQVQIANKSQDIPTT